MTDRPGTGPGPGVAYRDRDRYPVKIWDLITRLINRAKPNQKFWWSKYIVLNPFGTVDFEDHGLWFGTVRLPKDYRQITVFGQNPASTKLPLPLNFKCFDLDEYTINGSQISSTASKYQELSLDWFWAVSKKNWRCKKSLKWFSATPRLLDEADFVRLDLTQYWANTRQTLSTRRSLSQLTVHEILGKTNKNSRRERRSK